MKRFSLITLSAFAAFASATIKFGLLGTAGVPHRNFDAVVLLLSAFALAYLSVKRANRSADR